MHLLACYLHRGLPFLVVEPEVWGVEQEQTEAIRMIAQEQSPEQSPEDLVQRPKAVYQRLIFQRVRGA